MDRDSVSFASAIAANTAGRSHQYAVELTSLASVRRILATPEHESSAGHRTALSERICGQMCLTGTTPIGVSDLERLKSKLATWRRMQPAQGEEARRLSSQGVLSTALPQSR